MSDLLQVIDALCRLLVQAIGIIQDETSKAAMMQQLDGIMGEKQVKS